MDDFVQKQGLGPDAMEICIDFNKFRKILTGHRGAIKPLLMNQRTIAGIGNVYSDEILFQSGVHPQRVIGDLNAKERNSIFRNMEKVMRTAVDRRVGEKGWPEDWLLPHREPGEPCPRCVGKIIRLKISGCSAYLCQEHQKKRGSPGGC